MYRYFTVSTLLRGLMQLPLVDVGGVRIVVELKYVVN